MTEVNKPRSTSEMLRDAAARASSHITATAQARKVQEKATPQAATQIHQEEQVQVAERTATELKIKENLFYKALTDTQTTQEDKISAIANALDPKQQSMDKLLENYQLFQQYYTYIQSEDLDSALEGVERLIKELESNTKIEVGNILKHLQGMLSDIDSSRALVEILRKARMDKTTVSDLTEAFKRNEEVIQRLAELEKKKGEAQKEVDACKTIVDAKVKERDEKEATWGHWAKGLVKADTTYSDKVTQAEAFETTKKTALDNINGKIAELTALRRKDLEEGPLKILRSVDEVDDNLSTRLISSGRNGIETVRGAQKSVLQLFTRVAASESGINEISRRVADKQISLSVLQSGLLQASENTDGYKKEMEVKSQVVETALTTAENPADGEKPSILDVAKNRTKALELKKDLGEVIDYQGQLNNTISEMQLTLAKNIDRQSKTDNGKKIIQGTKKSVTILGRDALNTVAGNLETVLTSLVADQNDEMQQVVVQFASAASQMEHGIYEGMKVRAEEMHQKDMSYLDDTITRLRESSKMIAQTLETAVDEGIERAERQQAIKAATAELEEATTTARKVTGEMSDQSVRGGPARPADTAPEAAPDSPQP